MASKVLIASVVVLALAEVCLAGGYGGGHHKKVIIHVPYYVKKIHHTHTVYKHVGGEEHKDEGPKVIGYSGDGDVSLGHGHEESGGGEVEHGFVVGGDHGVWHSGGGGGSSHEEKGEGAGDGGSIEGAFSSIESWKGGSSGYGGGWESGSSAGGWENLGGSSGGGHQSGGWEGAQGGWDLGGAESYSGGSDSYGNVIGGGHGYDLTGAEEGHKGYD